MDFVTIHSVWTVLILVLFAGIAVWAYSPSRKSTMDAAGRSILDEDDTPAKRAPDA